MKYETSPEEKNERTKPSHDQFPKTELILLPQNYKD